MKNLKLALAVTAVASMMTLAACSSKSKQTEDTSALQQNTTAEANVESTPQPTYAAANLGASSSGRSK